MPRFIDAESERDALDGAADQLAEALVELERVDLNPMDPADVRALLDATDELDEICLRLRRRQHNLEDRMEDTDE